MKKLALSLSLVAFQAYTQPLTPLNPKIKAFITLSKNDAYRLAHGVSLPQGILVSNVRAAEEAQLIASELEAHFFQFSLADLQMIQKEHGSHAVSELLLSSEQIGAQSKQKKSVIFIKDLQQFTAEKEIKNEILNYFEKSDKSGKTLVIASCDAIENVDPAFVSDERFASFIAPAKRGIDNKKSSKNHMVVEHLPQQLKMILKLLKHQDKYKKQFNLTMPRGILLTGKPGTGKTEFARHVADELGGFFVLCSSTQFVTQWQGSGEQEIRKIFEAAKAHAQVSGKMVVIFLDEIDAIASLRTNNGVANMGYEKALNELLIQMDGFEQDNNILVVGATNIPDKLDPAIKRSGRFDYIVEIAEPTFSARKKLFEHFLAQFNSVDTDIKIDQLANKELTPADIKNIVNQAAHEAAFIDAPKITHKLLERALQNVLKQKKAAAGAKNSTKAGTWQDLVSKYN